MAIFNSKLLVITRGYGFRAISMRGVFRPSLSGDAEDLAGPWKFFGMGKAMGKAMKITLWF